MKFILHQLQWVPVVLFENQNQAAEDNIIRAEDGSPILTESGEPLFIE